MVIPKESPMRNVPISRSYYENGLIQCLTFSINSFMCEYNLLENQLFLFHQEVELDGRETTFIRRCWSMVDELHRVCSFLEKVIVQFKFESKNLLDLKDRLNQYKEIRNTIQHLESRINTAESALTSPLGTMYYDFKTGDNIIDRVAITLGASPNFQTDNMNFVGQYNHSVANIAYATAVRNHTDKKVLINFTENFILIGTELIPELDNCFSQAFVNDDVHNIYQNTIMLTLKLKVL